MLCWMNRNHSSSTANCAGWSVLFLIMCSTKQYLALNNDRSISFTGVEAGLRCMSNIVKETYDWNVIAHFSGSLYMSS